MNITQTKDNGKLTVGVEGRVDTVTAPELESKIKGNLDNVTELVIDCQKMDYISSAGLRVLLSLQKIINKSGNMSLVNVSDTVKEVFDVTGFSDILTIE